MGRRIDRLTDRPGEWSLAAQFALAGGIVMLLAMLLVGQWVAMRIEEAVVRNWANATALYMESFLAPISQELAQGQGLSPLAQRALDEVFTATALGQRVVSYKIWDARGRIIGASDKAGIGRQFPVGPDLARALSGEISAGRTDPAKAESAAEAALGADLLEIYSPVREVWSGRVVGVIEFYEHAEGLIDDIAEARRRSWVTVAAVCAGIGLLLWGIVARGSRMIETQRAQMRHQLDALRRLSEHNTALRLRVQGAAARAAAAQDQALRQIGADLHDGPAQLLGYAALRLDGLPTADAARLAEVERALRDAMREIRDISRGVALPDIAGRCPCDILSGLAEAHRARSGAAVALDCTAEALPELDVAVKTCIYRFVQEGLTNGWRHGGGLGQAVALRVVAGRMVLEVSDAGPGFAGDPATHDRVADDSAGPGSGLGLAGLRDRVEALGAQFEMAAGPAGGAMLRMILPLGPEGGQEI